jgi:NADP-dependent 3-hydroxy acid dehydrogenase YdfG
VASTAADYGLHPAMLDGALQAAIGLLMDEGGAPRLALPYALEQVDVYGPCSAQMWALVRPCADIEPDETMRRFDIVLCDADGGVCVELHGLSARLLKPAPQAGRADSLLLRPHWQAQALAAGGDPAAHARHVVLLCDVDGIDFDDVAGQMDAARCMRLPKGGEVAGEFLAQGQAVLAELRALLADKAPGRVLVQLVVPEFGERQVLSGLWGMLRTAQVENPKVVAQVIAVDRLESAEGLVRKLAGNARTGQTLRVRYDGDTRSVLGWTEVPAPTAPAVTPWRNNGVYLITGGLGGLGLIFAREIAQRVDAPTLVLTGRSSLTAAGQQSIAALEALGARVDYHAADIADRAATHRLLDAIAARHQGLHGIIHSAGVVRDSFILKKTPEELDAVFRAKVQGLVNLDEASKDMPLDCFICFSSLAATLGNVGQADYASANAFMDAYCAHRNSQVAARLRHGQAVSLNWPLWQEGGMQVGPAIEAMMNSQGGMTALPTTAGVDALYLALAEGHEQLMVMAGDSARLKASLAAALPLASPDDVLYRELLAQIVDGTLSEAQFESMIMG